MNVHERNPDATLYVGNLDSQVDEETLWELFVQCGPLSHCYLPKDKITGDHAGYGFVEFKTPLDAEYAVKIMQSIRLYGKAIRLNRASEERQRLDIGANLFVGGLDPTTTDEKMLQTAFSAFGPLAGPVRFIREDHAFREREREKGLDKQKAHAFVMYDSFESADAAIEALNGQFLGGAPVRIMYALKPGSKTERHGSAAERLLAANRSLSSSSGTSNGMSHHGTGIGIGAGALSLPPPLLASSSSSSSSSSYSTVTLPFASAVPSILPPPPPPPPPSMSMMMQPGSRRPPPPPPPPPPKR
jgi:splicing factor 3B subunit 4